MTSLNLPIWKTAPFIRLLVPFVGGILIQWYCQLIPLLWTIVLVVSCILYMLFFFLPIRIRYKWNTINGIAATFILLSLGGLITWCSDIRNDAAWFGHAYKAGNIMLVRLDEPLVEKPRSYKAQATVEAMIPYGNVPRHVPTDSNVPAKGHIIIYFKKDSLLHQLSYGAQVAFSKKLEPINNMGNSFDYRRYCLFQSGITHQVYLKPTDLVILPEKKTNWFSRFIFSIQDHVLTTIRTNIKSKKETGLAEALLIGYQDDVDKSLIQSYSNTGVIHVIAISGMHLGLIYWLLVLILKPLDATKKLRYINLVIIVCCLWLFSILAGAQPSILRSAVMFSFLLIGRNIARNMPIINSLAASAFLLLCYNPFWLWNIGFQLSYVALLSIVIFMKPVYNMIYVKNKGLDQIWQLAAVSLAAQLLTTPFILYHFHQFPTYFLITNMIAVPLSSLVLLGEIALCVVYFIPVVSTFMGKVLCFLIWTMNSSVEYLEVLPFSVWKELNINLLQAISMELIVAGFGYWLIEKQKTGCWVGIIASILFLIFRF